MQPVKQSQPTAPSRPPPVQKPPVQQPASSAPQPTEEDEKEQLIKQVLSLSDEQVSLLPPDQRESIIQLREQLKKQVLAGI
jgi:cleavage stimulation factor subunit 2